MFPPRGKKKKELQIDWSHLYTRLNIFIVLMLWLMFFSEAISFAVLMQIVNAAVIVDPSVKQVIVRACDQFCTCSFAMENSIESCSKKHEALGFHLDSNGVAGNMTFPSNGSANENKRSYTGVSCLNPWQWAHQKSHSTSCNWHPLRHAAMVTIESSAARDRLLYPSLGHEGDNFIPVDSIQSSSTGTPAKRQKTDLPNVS